MSIKGAEQNSSLDLFRIPPTDLSTVKYRYVKIPPQTSSITPIQVYVERQSDLIDLSRSFVQLDLGFKTTENANLTARAYNVGMMTSPANNIAHTLFKQINFRANGTLLTQQVNMYHLKAFIQTILNYDRNDGETILEPAGWRNEIDSPVTYTAANVKMDDDAYTALSINHQESIKRQRADATEYYAGGKRRILRMKPFIDAFHQGKWIVPKTLLELEFYLNPAALFMNGEANPPSEEVRVNPEDIKLTFFLCLVSLNPAVYMSMMSMMTKTPAKYPMIRTEMRQFPLDNGTTSKEINEPFNGKVPQRVIIGILKTTAFNGQYNEDPLAFGKFGVEYIKQIVNGEEYPYETLELNTANGQKDLVGYHRFLDATGCLYRNAGNMVRFKDWGHGKNCTLFAFSNVANGRHDDPVLLPKNEGFINIHIKCAGQASQKTVIVYAEYEGIMEIDGIKGATTMEVH